MTEPLAVSIAEAARLIGLSPRTVRDWCQRRRISHHRLGRRIVIPMTEVVRLLENSHVPARVDPGGGRRPSGAGG